MELNLENVNKRLELLRAEYEHLVVEAEQLNLSLSKVQAQIQVFGSLKDLLEDNK